MRILAPVLSTMCLWSAIGCSGPVGGAAGALVRPVPGEFARHQVTISVDSGDKASNERTKIVADAAVYCLSHDAQGTHFVLQFRSTDAASDKVRTAAWLVLDNEGGLLPDLAVGRKISLDPASWSAVGLIPRVRSDRLVAGEHRETAVPVYGDLQTLPLLHTVTRPDATIRLRRECAPGQPLKIGRSENPTLQVFRDDWTLDTHGRPIAWQSRTEIRFPQESGPARTVTVVMTAQRTSAGRLNAAELDRLRRDAAELKPTWEALVDPEPVALAHADVDAMQRKLDEFLGRLSASRLADAAAALKDNLGRLRGQAAAVQEESKLAKALVGRPAPDFQLKTVDGRTVRLSEFRGKPVLLVFWGIGCRLCRTEAPELTQLHEKYGAGGLTVLAVECFGNTPQDVRAYSGEHGLKHLIVIDGAETASQKYFVGGLPRVFWIDRGGNIIERETGFTHSASTEEKIRRLLSENTAK